MNEPPINRNPNELDPEFRRRLAMTLGMLALEGIYMKLNEGLRTVERQSWLYAQGRTREGLKVTNLDGVRKQSYHQTGKAADCYPITGAGGKVIINPPEAIWRRYAEAAESNGLVAGYRWTKPHDPPHVELR
jgi:peptidoglycan L-alanyl-D-glutamate endopeptidase CwlK